MKIKFFFVKFNEKSHTKIDAMPTLPSAFDVVIQSSVYVNGGIGV